MFQSKTHFYLFIIICSQSAAMCVSAQVTGVSLSELMRSDDPRFSQNARTLSRGLQLRRWSFIGGDGQPRIHADRFDGIVSDDQSVWVEFRSGEKLPWDSLSDRDRTWIESIRFYQSLVEEDSLRYRMLKQQMAADAEWVSREQKGREREQRGRIDPRVTVASVLVPSIAEVSLANEFRSIHLNQGEIFEVLGIRDRFVCLKVGGQPGTVPRHSVRMRKWRASEVTKRIPHSANESVVQPPPSSHPWPQRLDVDIDFLAHRGVVEILINDVLVHGVGDRMGLQPQDRIVRVNGQSVTSKDQFRQAVLSPTAPVFLVQSPVGDHRVLRLEPTIQHSLSSGVNSLLSVDEEYAE